MRARVIWCFVTDAGAVIRLSPTENLGYLMRRFPRHWVELAGGAR